MPPSRRSSRRSRHRRGGGDIAPSLRRWLKPRRIAAIVAALFGIYLLGWAFKFWTDTTVYLDLEMTDNQPVVLYALGYPSAVREGPGEPWLRTRQVSIASANTSPATASADGRTVYGYPQWAYTLPEGGQAQFEFEPGGELLRYSCMHPEAAAGACPGLLGVELGDDEFRPLWKLGNPPRSRISGLTRTFHYDDIGVEFGLERRRVYRIAVTRSTGGAGGHILRYFRSLVP